MNAQGELEVIDAVKTVRPPHFLSLGTRQQLYLSLRIALLLSAANVGRGLPVLCDDILVNFDDERRAQAPCFGGIGTVLAGNTVYVPFGRCSLDGNC